MMIAVWSCVFICYAHEDIQNRLARLVPRLLQYYQVGSAAIDRYATSHHGYFVQITITTVKDALFLILYCTPNDTMN